MNLRADLKASLRHNIPLSDYSTMQVGGPARDFAEPKTEEELLELLDYARQEAIPFFILGKGSNCVFSDQGFAGLVIALTRYEQERILVDQDELTLTASSGIHLSRLVLCARDAGLGGAEFLCNVPGTLGGALIMNAGFSRYAGQRSEIGDIARCVRTVTPEGNLRVFDKKDLKFSYRKSNLSGLIVLEGTLQLWKRPKEDIQAEIRANFDFRNEKQDLQYPSSGSIFKNPDSPAPAAAALVEQAGFKGKQIGQAKISSKHSNYIINLGQAKTSDIVQLIRETQKAVLNATGIKLETEVRIIEEN